MAAKKKTVKSPRSRAKKTTRSKAASRKAASKPAAKRKLQAKKPVLKRTSTKPTAKSAQEMELVDDTLASLSTLNVQSGSRPSGDLQGVSRRHSADSESVEELLDEGNTLEAGIVSGVEEADDDEPREVRTRQVPEDDVPDEYLERD